MFLKIYKLCWDIVWGEPFRRVKKLAISYKPLVFIKYSLKTPKYYLISRIKYNPFCSSENHFLKLKIKRTKHNIS